MANNLAVTRVAIALVAVLAVAGCAALTGIPSGWPSRWPALARVEPGRCPDISGTYRDVDEGPFKPDVKARSLGYRLVREIAGGNGVVRISRHGDKEMRVQVSRADEGAGTFVLVAGENGFVCEDEGVRVKGETLNFNNGGWARRSESTAFRKTVDGSLAGKQRNVSFGLILYLIPLPAVTEFWFMWRHPEAPAGRP